MNTDSKITFLQLIKCNLNFFIKYHKKIYIKIFNNIFQVNKFIYYILLILKQFKIKKENKSLLIEKKEP